MAEREERCELTDLIKTQCAHCLGHAEIGGTTGVEVIADGDPFTAQYSTRECMGTCGRGIEAGELIVHVLDSTGYAHAGCAS